MEQILQVGVITTTHGVHGEVKVFPTTDDPARFKRCKELLLHYKDEEITLKVVSVKFFKNLVILKFEGIESPEEAAKYRQCSLFVTRENAVRLRRDEYFIADLIGLKVIDEEENEIGVLEDVMQTGANDVYSIKMTDGRELLLPAIKDCILEVAVLEGFMKVHILEGLLE